MARASGSKGIQHCTGWVSSNPRVIAEGAIQSRVAHNTLLNFLGLAIPLALAFFDMPVAARHLGPARFGLLGLAWAVTEYLVLFDLGLGRATVKFVADTLHRNPDDVTEIAALSTSIQFAAGIFGGAAFALFAPVLVRLAFHLPSAISGEAVGMFRVVGLSLPVVLLLSGFRGILEGAQRFDLSNAIRMLSSAVSVAIPAIGAVAGASLPNIMWWILLSRAIVCVLYVMAIRRALPAVKWKLPRRWNRARELLSFGGWVLVSNAISPVLVYFDRFALGAISGIAAVGFYTAPYEGVTRLLLVAVSLAASLLPALTSLETIGDRQRSNELVSSSARTLMVVMAPPLALVFAFAPALLHVWLGSAYAAASSTALRVVAIGVFANALAQLPFVTLYASNRPDLPAKFHIIELVIHVPLTILLVRQFGIVGAAAAWTSRVILDLCLLTGASAHCTGVSVEAVAGGRVWRIGLATTALVVGLLGAAAILTSMPGVAMSLTVASLAAFLTLSWRFILLPTERRAIGRILGVYGASFRRSRINRPTPPS
jgi:O-antigen/teichoic acid export membrane protein